jgi:eukaryotic-like serine/threonine-protein kinase
VLERLGRHPQIPQLLAHFAIDQELFIVQDYVEGHSLRQEIRPGRRLNEDHVVRFLYDILEILVFVHDNGVIHRDIKPENIMRRSDGKLVLIDFGAVKEFSTMAINPVGQVATSVVIGTMGYMPTEQAKGKPRLCSDVYAVGMIAIEALTGVYPLSLPEDPYTGDIIWRDQVEIDERFADILQTMVRDRYAQRYPSAREALQALTQAIDLPPSSAFTVTPATKASATLLQQIAEKDPLVNILTMNLDVLSVNVYGQETVRRAGEVEFFTEELGQNTIMEMVAIPGGDFLMGTPSDRSLESVESPQHEVTIQPFFMSMFPVTQAQWKAVAALPQVQSELNPDPARFKGADRPVEMVSWDDAIEFCQRLSQRTQRTYRLPSEAEWEYACRAGTLTPFHFGETITPDLANYNGNYIYNDGPKGVYRDQTTPIGSFPANAFGLHDMHGNIWEWCADHWHDNYEGAPSDGRPWLVKDPHHPRLLRGGAWNKEPGACRSAYRDRDLPTTRNKFIGFRVVCEVAGP